LKHCPACKRIEADDTLVFCRVDGTALVINSSELGGEAGTAKLGTKSGPPEIETSILPHATNTNVSKGTGPTTVLATPAPVATVAVAKPKTRRTAIVLVVILTAVVSAVSAVVVRSYLSRKSERSIESIAVLPFVNKSGDVNSEYLSDGLAESLIYRLSRLPNLKVSPTSSVIHYKGKNIDVAKIASELGVDAVMTGRLAQIGDNLTISVELVDVQKNKLLWGEQYERKMSELLATQREIATEITNKLQLKLSGEDTKGFTKRYTDNDEAYQLYLKGRYHFTKRNKDDILKSVEYFQQAIKLDPKYALAYAGLADSFNGMTAYPYLSPKEAVPQAKAAATRALEIDPSLSEAHTALANSLACFDWNWNEAEREFKRALELKPNDAGTLWRYGMFYLMPMGRSDEAIVLGKRAVELEPLNLNHGANLSGMYFHGRQYDRALVEAKQVFDLDPNFIVGRWALSQVYIVKGRYDEAIALNEQALRSEPTNQVFLRFAGLAHAKAGHRKEAEEILKRFSELAKTQYVMSYYLAMIYVALDEKDKAFVELEKAFTEHDYFLVRIKVEPFFDPLHDDPRFKEMVKRLNLSE
jgi:TolB-like protein/Tfp pilus assembly protein PilF